MPAAADGTGSWSSSDLAFPHAFTVVKNANITVNSNTEATDITTNTPMLAGAGRAGSDDKFPDDFESYDGTVRL